MPPTLKRKIRKKSDRHFGVISSKRVHLSAKVPLLVGERLEALGQRMAQEDNVHLCTTDLVEFVMHEFMEKFKDDGSLYGACRSFFLRTSPDGLFQKVAA
jgi:hypothetical protein